MVNGTLGEKDHNNNAALSGRRFEADAPDVDGALEGCESQNEKSELSYLHFRPKANSLEALVAEAIAGNEAAIDKVIELHYQDILYFAIKKVGAQDGQDVAQHAISCIIDRLESLKDPAKFKSWMMSLVYHDCIDYMRQLKQRNDATISIIDPEENFLEQIADDDRELLPEAVLVSEEDRKLVLEVLDQLPENYADCIRLRYYDGLSNPEIAEVLGVDEKKVRNDMHRGLALFKKRFEGKTGDKYLYGAAPLGAVPVLTEIFQADKAELVMPERAADLLRFAKGEVASRFGGEPASGAAKAGAVKGVGAGKLVAGTLGVVAVAGAIALFVWGAPAESPDPEPEQTAVIAPEPKPEPEPEPAKEIEIRTVADMIGEEDAELLAVFEAGSVDEQAWEDFLVRIGAHKEDSAFEPDYTYNLYVLEKQDKQLLLADRVSVADGAITVLSQFGYIEEIPLMMRVILMFP